MSRKTYLVMAGGTGGHVYPALATARALIYQGDAVVWMGSRNGMEERIIGATDIPFRGLSVKGLRGKGLSTRLLAPFRLLLSLMQALVVVYRVNPDCVLGMGGYASGPGGLAAKIMGKPLVIHEQNAIAGLTNRLLARLANSVLEAFPDAFPPQLETQVVGNPIRQEICQLFFEPKDIMANRNQARILVLGGSLGAARLNETVPKAIASLDESIRPEVWHQTGENKLKDTRALYEREKLEVRIDAFIEDMSEAYRWADFVICRAGALTISELCAAGLGAVLVPYPYAVDDHQTLNAKTMEQAGAAWILQQQSLDPGTLADVLVPLLQKPIRLQKLSDAAKKLAKPDATEIVANICRRLCYA
ncbi:MAG: undecaprenyldiphospho-muramoylpentapeptide beta-N-acetylglucosaminyltransferase [Oleiphilus sp.]|nr:MAG: undecaprenyldiphospho-muramoylpentapeptide beta-N-acetylglucosaminyltransferase [Oleiphilus sp.]